VRSDEVEERRLLDSGQSLDLLLRSECREFGGIWIELLRLRLKIPQSLNIGWLTAAGESSQSPVDEIDTAGLARTGVFRRRE
jgi:hypothetical protein